MCMYIYTYIYIYRERERDTHVSLSLSIYIYIYKLIYLSGCFCLFVFVFGARLAYNLSGYGVTLLSGSIATSSGMARRAAAPTLRPNQLWTRSLFCVCVIRYY